MGDLTKADAEVTERCVKALLNIPGAMINALAVGTVVDLILTIPMKFAWNYVMPYLFGLPEVGYLRIFLLMWLLTSLWKITPVSIPTPIKNYK